MLVKFRVKNFLSFKDLQELSFVEGKTNTNKDRFIQTEKMNLLTFGAIYGANASGKSNFIKAIDFAKRKLTDETNFVDRESYFKLDDKCKLEPSYFEFEIYLDGKYYAYGFEIILSEDKVVSEWLVELTEAEESIIFSRNLVSQELEYNSVYFNTSHSSKEILERMTKENKFERQLYMYVAREFLMFPSNLADGTISLYDHTIPKVAMLLRKSIIISLGYEHITFYNDIIEDDVRKNIVGILRIFDVGIKDIVIKEVEVNFIKEKYSSEELYRLISWVETHKKNAVFKNLDGFFIFSSIDNTIKCYTLKFVQINNVEFNYSQLSDGTKRLLDLIGILISKNSVFIIDEIDRYLHPLLIHKLIELYLGGAKKNNLQLILTTHDTGLLDKDFIRRDEVWFVDKNNNGESELRSLDQYKDIFDDKLRIAYLEGRYRGIPKLNSYCARDII